jgi:HK97 family phage portal protein
VGIFDWMGPTALTKRRGWGDLPAPTPEERGSPRRLPAPITGAGSPTFYPTTLVHEVLSGTAGAAGNSAVLACLQALAVAAAEPEPVVYRTDGGERIKLDATPLGDLLARPNPHFSFDALIAYLVVSLHVDGNAYWRKLRAGDPVSGNVVELWPVSPSKLEPYTRAGTTEYISGYRYTPEAGRAPELLDPSNVVHFRYGLDDGDHRLGFSPLKRLVREISSDNQATRYADRLLANLAINGLTMTFDKEAPPITQEVADELKSRITALYGGDNAGATAVLSPGASLTALGFSPEQMDLKVLHRVPEERISAVLGVPAIVAGLGAGLDRSTYANVREAREMFTEQKLIPLWRSLAAEITMSLVPDFADAASTLVDFDTSAVRALSEDQNAGAIRLQTLVAAGIITVDEARAEIGLDALPEREAPPAPAQLPIAASRRATEIRAVRVPESKAIDEIPDEIDRIRDGDEAIWLAAVAAYLAAQSTRVVRRHRAGAEDARDLVPDTEAALLGAELEPLALRLLGMTSRMLSRELAASFELHDAAVRSYLESAGANVRGITETTREAVSSALVDGHAAGEGVEAVAIRLGRLPAFSESRARTIAKTELRHASAEACLASYAASGVVVGVTVRDGDQDQPCATRNGTELTLEQAQAAPRLLHPNCTVSYHPRLADEAGAAQSA